MVDVRPNVVSNYWSALFFLHQCQRRMGSQLLYLIALAFAICLLTKLANVEAVTPQTVGGLVVAVILIYIMCLRTYENYKRKRRRFRRPPKRTYRRRRSPSLPTSARSRRRTFYGSQPGMIASETYFREDDDAGRAKKLQTMFGYHQ